VCEEAGEEPAEGLGARQAGKEGGRDPEGSRHLGRGCDANPLHLRLLQSLRLGAPVLEPDLDLDLGEFEVRGELGPLRDGEVLLFSVLFLQGVELLGRERRARLAVWFVLAEVAPEGAELWPRVRHISVKHG